MQSPIVWKKWKENGPNVILIIVIWAHDNCNIDVTFFSSKPGGLHLWNFNDYKNLDETTEFDKHHLTI